MMVEKHELRPMTHLCFQSAHIHLIDALMMAYTLEMISVEKVVSCVKRFSNLSTKELPFDLEDAMVFWINKVRPSHVTRLVSALGHSVSVVPGEHENEGDGGKRAEDETPSAGVARSPEGNTPSWCLTTSPVVCVSCLSPILLYIFLTWRLNLSGIIQCVSV